MANIGINGFGRVGRSVLRAAIEKGANIVAINDPFIGVEYMAYLLKYDSTYGRYKGVITVESNSLVVNGQHIQVFSERDPKEIRWANAGAEYIIEATGVFTTTEKAAAHFNGGALRVIIAAPSADAPVFICGVNLDTYEPSTRVICCGGGITNCLAPFAKLIHDNFEIVEGLVTAVQSLIATQKIVDGPSGKLWRDGRAAIQNIIPAATSSARSIGKVIPSLNGKLNGVIYRVPVASVSVIDFAVHLGKPTTYESIKQKVREAAEGPLRGILDYTEDEVVSSDFIGNSNSTIFDARAGIPLSENFMKLVCWYDNEYGYASRIVDIVKHMQSVE